MTKLLSIFEDEGLFIHNMVIQHRKKSKMDML